jgi:hypothetical protein
LFSLREIGDENGTSQIFWLSAVWLFFAASVAFAQTEETSTETSPRHSSLSHVLSSSESGTSPSSFHFAIEGIMHRHVQVLCTKFGHTAQLLAFYRTEMQIDVDA